MPELFTELRFSVLREFWTQEIRLPLLGGDAPQTRMMKLGVQVAKGCHFHVVKTE